MKKLGFALVAAALAGAPAFSATEPSVAATPDPAERFPRSPVQISLVDPVQLPSSDWDITALRVNLLYGVSHRMTGFDLGLVGLTREDMDGIALHAVNWVESNATGIQLGAVANVVGSDATGLQLGGVLNRNVGVFTGFQAALMNHNGSLLGAQISLLNWTKGTGYGFQLGLVNADVNDFRGGAFGLLNAAEAMSGVQFGVVNLAETFSGGVQLGVFNAATTMTGIQIGVLNLIGDAAVPVLPVVNGNF